MNEETAERIANALEDIAQTLRKIHASMPDVDKQLERIAVEVGGIGSLMVGR